MPKSAKTKKTTLKPFNYVLCADDEKYGKEVQATSFSDAVSRIEVMVEQLLESGFFQKVHIESITDPECTCY